MLLCLLCAGLATAARFADFGHRLTGEESKELDKTCGLTTRLKRVACDFGKVECDRVPVGKYPWAVQVTCESNACSGTLISKRHVITAAHCFHDSSVTCGKRHSLNESSFVYAFVGTNTIETTENRPRAEVMSFGIKIKNVIVHDKYCKEGQSQFAGYDIALVELAEEVPDVNAGPICLPNRESEREVPITMTVAGFGDNANRLGAGESEGEAAGVLLEAPLSLVRDRAPILRKLNGYYAPGTFLTDPSTGYDTCVVDSGSGLFTRRREAQSVLYGVLIGGPGCDGRRNTPLAPDTRMRDYAATLWNDVRSYTGWICAATGACHSRGVYQGE